MVGRKAEKSNTHWLCLGPFRFNCVSRVLRGNDYAKVITSSDEKSIRNMLADLEAQTGIEATVLTINSIYDHDTDDKPIESFATNLFNTWGIGDREENNGFMILVAVHDRRVRIELGSGYSSASNWGCSRRPERRL
jgi:uncharacterized membrane protein YgcG